MSLFDIAAIGLAVTSLGLAVGFMYQIAQKDLWVADAMRSRELLAEAADLLADARRGDTDQRWDIAAQHIIITEKARRMR